ncbi:MAG: ABC transporter ATP-binding protein [Planctomycetes bacterium]|nr:ABC transporter ATP-binding protein [Planctomycetota bacterium]
MDPAHTPPRADPALAIRIEGLSKTFRPLRLGFRSLRWVRRLPPVEALRGVDLQVREGEIVGLLGANGSGKSTLLKILATLVLPDAGRVEVGGVDLARQPGEVRRRVGFASADERSFYWRLTGRENLAFFAAFHGLAPRDADGRIDRLREEIGLDALDRRYGEYSTGMRHRLAIARALLHEPRILLLDEPTRSLDPIAADVLRGILRRTLAGRKGCAILLATHDLQEAQGVCDRIALLHRGERAAFGIPSDLLRGGEGLLGLFRALAAGGDA